MFVTVRCMHSRLLPLFPPGLPSLRRSFLYVLFHYLVAFLPPWPLLLRLSQICPLLASSPFLPSSPSYILQILPPSPLPVSYPDFLPSPATSPTVLLICPHAKPTAT